jgi:hypothetical protein
MEYYGPPEGAEILLSKEVLPLEFFEATGDEMLFPPLALALRGYSYSHTEDLKQWESLIRKLLHRGADLHAPVLPNHRSYTWDLGERPGHGTPLDELFLCTRTLVEAKTAADDWLQILSSEGYDVLAYLHNEMELHSTHPQLTFPSDRHRHPLNFYRSRDNPVYYPMPRELRFIMHETKPSVYWDWWIDPESPTYLVCNEFRDIYLRDFWWALRTSDRTWDMFWPFDYPAWDNSHQPVFYQLPRFKEESLEWQRLRDNAERRANRRLQRAHAAITGSRRMKYPRMPGAWQT